MAKMIGLTSFAVRYQRTSMRLNINDWYFIILYSFAAISLWLVYDELPVLALTSLAVFIINQRVMRFSDLQSMIILFVSVFCAEILSSAPSLIGLLVFMLVANPIPAFLSLCSSRNDGTVVRPVCLKPFDHSRLQKEFERFFHTVPTGTHVYFAFDDPQGEYEKIFDGYRNLIELPIYVASKRGIHLFPDWYAVAETNYPGAPNCWGRTIESVSDNVKRWKASYVIVYQRSGTTLSTEWEKSGFSVVTCFDWKLWIENLRGQPLWSTEGPPCWWLLKAPSTPVSAS